MNGNAVNRGQLDAILEDQGKEACQAALDAAFRLSPDKAVALLTEEALSYPCFYTLLPRISALNLHSYVSSNARVAAAITERIVTPNASAEPNYLKGRHDFVHSALKWMLLTGWESDQDADMRMALDAAASTLINTYQDNDALKTVCDMLVRRGVKGYNTHYLVWAYFHAHNPASIRLMAEYLRSADPAERSFAAGLLHADEAGKKTGMHEDYLHWLHENDPFLYFTDESPQYTANHHAYKVDLERKYLNKKSDSYDKIPAIPEDEEEEAALAAFKACSEEDMALLSGYSQMLCKNNSARWRSWIRSPIEAQMREAQRDKEGRK